MTIPVLYFHGFASSPGSAKVGLLRERLEPEGFRFTVPDMNVPSFEKLDWEAMVGHAVREGERIAPRLIVGSSLGSLLTLEVVRHGIHAPIVMIAPALGVAQRWSERIPEEDPVRVYNHAVDREVPIHRRFFEQMAELEIDRDPPPVPVTALMGTRDESIPFELVKERWESWEESGLVEGSKLIEIPGGDHGLTGHVERIAEAMRRSGGGERREARD
jgi:predicted esterase YcpF (UPF0227 family)